MLALMFGARRLLRVCVWSLKRATVSRTQNRSDISILAENRCKHLFMCCVFTSSENHLVKLQDVQKSAYFYKDVFFNVTFSCPEKDLIILQFAIAFNVQFI